MTKITHKQTVDRVVRLEIGHASDIGAASLLDAIIEALTEGGVIEEANIVYMRTDDMRDLIAVDVWVPEQEEKEAAEAETDPHPLQQAPPNID